MAKDPAFLFYPGDYLRDTQCLSEKTQVAYDRIMCEHMRHISEDMINIVLPKNTIDFFSKRLSDGEKSELMHVLTEIDGGYQIEWVALSLANRKAYSNSRAKNRGGTNEKDMKTHDVDMENENENINEVDIKDRQKRFAEELELYIEVYPKEMLEAFWEYWTEPNKSKTKMKMELQKTWDISRRLKTWERNQEKFGGAGGKSSNESRESKLRKISESIANDPDLK